MINKLLFICCCLLFVSAAEAQNGTVTINFAGTEQRIDGFGASSAWMNAPLSAADADLIFSTNTGAGLSLLRTRIAPGGVIDDSEGTIAQEAAGRGARVWSTPWSPPANLKDSGSVDGGNYLDTAANNATYGSELAGYVTTMLNSYGVTLYAVSVQNEPDVNTTGYESCEWTSAQIHDFVPWLSAQLATAGVGGTKIMLPEDEFWQWNLATDTLDDTNTAPLIGILAAHNYNNNYNEAPTPLFTSNLSSSNTVPVWETEHYFGTDDTITNGLQLAQEIHNFMTVGNANAYHYWWLLGSGNGSIVDNDAAPAKRLFVMGNYSRFVRANFYRIDAANTSGALVSAYKDPVSSNLVIVAANPTTSTINQTFVLTNCSVVTNVTPWLTSAAFSLASQTPFTVTNGSFSYALPPLTVISFVPSGVANWSFESQPVAAGSYVNLGTGAPTGWNSSGAAGVVNAVVALVHPAASDGRGYGNVPVPGMDGSNYCQIYAYAAGGTGMIYKDSGIRYQAGVTYQVTAAFGLENGNFATNSTLCLLNSTNLAVIASTTINPASLAFGAFTDVTLNYTATGNEGGNGDIVIGFSVPGTPGSAFFDFDNVRLVTKGTPSITSQPASQAVPPGGTVSFSVGVSGTAPFSYQWQATNSATGGFTNLVNGGKISGATNSVLTITNVTSNWALTYRVVVTNAYGSVTSSPASLTLLPAGFLVDVQYLGSATNPNNPTNAFSGTSGTWTGPGTAFSGAAVLGSAGDTWNQEPIGYYYNGSPNPYFNAVSLVNSTAAASGLTLTLGFQSIIQGAALAGTAADAATTNLMQSSVFIYTWAGGAGAGNATTTHTIGGLSGYAGYMANLVVYAGAPGAQTEQIALAGGATGGNSGSTLTTSSTSRKLSTGAGVAYNLFTNLTLSGGNLVFTVNETGAAANANAGYVNGFQLQVLAPTPPASTNAFLTSLALNPALNFTPAFASNVLTYAATEAYGSTPTVTVTDANVNATNQLIYNGATNLLASGAASSAMTLNPNPGVTNVVHVQVTAQDGVTIQTYTVNMTQLPNQTTPPGLTNSTGSGMLNLNWGLDRLGYRLLVQTNNLNLGVSSNPNDWATVPGSTATNSMAIPIIQTSPNEYYQLVYP